MTDGFAYPTGTRLSAVSRKRSDGVNCGRRVWRRRIASSWRKTRISSTFELSQRTSRTTNSNNRQART